MGVRNTGVRYRGFTLIELIITIVVIAILAAIALPSFSNLMRNGRITAQVNDLVSALNLARSEAVTRTRGVSACAADTSAGTPAACGSSGDWEKGWVVFVDDTAGSAAPTAIPAANILRTWVASPKTTVSTSTNFIRFTPSGQNALSSEIEVDIVPSDGCSGQQLRAIHVNPVGRVESVKLDCP
jgi:type IV fimbrial biogenesis protein FimT